MLLAGTIRFSNLSQRKHLLLHILRETAISALHRGAGSITNYDSYWYLSPSSEAPLPLAYCRSSSLVFHCPQDASKDNMWSTIFLGDNCALHAGNLGQLKTTCSTLFWIISYVGQYGELSRGKDMCDIFCVPLEIELGYNQAFYGVGKLTLRHLG